MSKGKKQVGPQLDREEQRRLKRFMNANGFESEANGAKKAMLRGLSDWEQKNDPSYSWLLHMGLAAGLWSILSVIGTVRLGTPPWDISAFSIWMAFVFLTGHIIQIARSRGWASRLTTGREATQ